ncbi:MAG: class I SAM-dependent methyltransferase [Acidobacteria bacterium]|nr:class I SAM-dependent methyltransferase [Acidobacteriota bacterium]MCB9397995.1 class I SAM-dependent methyltransferase [Acidobacteriota bacterium]
MSVTFICPDCLIPLQSFSCTRCQKTYPLQDGVWRFSDSAYSENFGFQWQRHAKTQLDSHSGKSISRDRLYAQSGWSAESLKGRTVLECGSGAGRFTEILAQTGCDLLTFDLSEAVMANYQNNHHYPNVRFFQASIYDLPIPQESVDYCVCLGVLQHTPNVQKTFQCLLEPLKKGGRFCFDVYAAPYSFLHPRVLIRPFTRKMNPQKLYRRVERAVPYLLPISNGFHKLPVIGAYLARMVPVANWRQNLSLNNEKQWREWAVLDTFDWLSATYERPVFKREIIRWCQELRLSFFEVERRRGLYVVRGVK